jgi:phosphodiesterase/alkaline phosphatase D-like protein
MRNLLMVCISLSLIALLASCFSSKAETQVIPSEQKESESSSTNEFSGSIILGRPTETEMTVSILSLVETELYLTWGTESHSYSYSSSLSLCDGKTPSVIVLDKLLPGQKGYYQLFFKEKGMDQFEHTEEYSFQLPRTDSAPYSFVLQSDSHLLNEADPELYFLAMEKMHSLNPDFIFDLGDTFINDQGKDPRRIAQDPFETASSELSAISCQQLPYFDVVTKNAPLFLVLGNHEGEFGAYMNGSENNLAVQSTLVRTTYYPNPIPNGFYSGNTESEQFCANPQNYYAFTWGDALYVSLDPYRYTTELGSEGWNWTLGKEQYDWFRATLENSTASYKFVFAHHAIGNIRGGSKVANLYEWGGYDKKGTYLFDEKRPGWGKPIQQVMEDAGVTIFFQGHDHVFSREMVGSVVYQTLPKPAEKVPDQESNYDAYPDGDTLLNSGFLKVSVSEAQVQVDYYRTHYVSTDSQIGNTGIVYSYTVDPEHRVTVLQSHIDNLSSYGGKKETTGKKPSVRKNQVDEKTGSQSGPTEKDVSAVQGKTNNGQSLDKKLPEKGKDEVVIGLGAQSESALVAVPPQGFSFAIQADSHLDENTDFSLYEKTLHTIVETKPDFLIDLGDTFMCEKFSQTKEDVDKQYLQAKSYFDLLGDLPLFLVTGNHDGEAGYPQKVKDLAFWARTARHTYFPSIPYGTDYSGNTENANYYSFVQGNARFIILDPYTFNTERVPKTGSGWSSTLGDEQYHWLESVLEKNTATFTFVFIHNLLGGMGKDQRGGAEAAAFFEWGGNSENGYDDFKEMRPLWSMPVHDLLVKYGVSGVFHGHDHFYARQDLDGLVYQLVPQPGSPGNSVYDATKCGYESGVFLPSAGFLRVVVGTEDAHVEYLQTQKDGTYRILDSYSIRARETETQN